jgi:hypothetical protein
LAKVDGSRALRVESLTSNGHDDTLRYMKDRKSPPKSTGSVDEFFRSVYDSLSVKVLAEAAASAPPSSAADDDLEALEAQIEQAALPKARSPEKKRARS